VKFNDADLIGVPLRAIIGPKALARGEIELQGRAGKGIQPVKISEAAAITAIGVLFLARNIKSKYALIKIIREMALYVISKRISVAF